ncbi:hypothetical protein [Enterococcus aquimarinus]|uniref:Uncharacterized protein n=1 Tax=Enterococcus aquimarinus TaxID=328396 RepID=A0A1L8QP96_9ENTE|nr:hypothetical protein [Enterococcus aquimarinus]OJG09334.1 hypothetical protein RU93_GL000820 [Enterococcus aquimarinus]
MFLENVFRDSYVKEVFFINNEEGLDSRQEKRNQNILTKIESLYYYYFIYQLYADYRYWLDDKDAYSNELKRFNASTSDNHYGYFSMLKRCFIQAFGSIKQFN